MQVMRRGFCLLSLVGGAWGLHLAEGRITLIELGDFEGNWADTGLLFTPEPFHVITPYFKMCVTPLWQVFFYLGWVRCLRN